jgi:hypothetical protein
MLRYYKQNYKSSSNKKIDKRSKKSSLKNYYIAFSNKLRERLMIAN